MTWDPLPGAVKAVKDARRLLNSTKAARDRAIRDYRLARGGYDENLRKAVEVLTEHTDMTTREIAQALGLRSPSTISDIRHGRR